MGGGSLAPFAENGTGGRRAAYVRSLVLRQPEITLTLEESASSRAAECERAMFQRFDESAKRALLLSRRIANRDGAAVVEPHHISLALQVAIPEASGLPIEEAHEDYQKIIFSLASKRSLAYAAHECERLRERLISPTHILIGLDREQHGDSIHSPLPETHA